MQLIKLELNNIKSYKQETINFSNGINCILGLNGSGKSTIIESIGSVLFNYNQRTINNLLRYNETKGSISLTLLGNDSITYQIIKSIRNKGNGNVKIINCENNEVLYEGTSDVYQFVKTILKISKDKSLSKLFEEIIAVPQGTFVNAFLETPKNRKENFDKLFELDIYKKLADNIKELSDKVKKDYIYIKEKEKAELEGKLSEYESIINEEKDLENKIIEAKNKLQEINLIYNKKENEKKELTNKKIQLDELNKKLFEVTTIRANFQEKIKANNENLLKSTEAKKVIKENEFGYRIYEQQNKKLEKYEIEYKNYLQLKDKYKDNEIIIKQLEEKNKALKEMLHNLKVTLGNNRQTIIDKNNINEEKNKLITECQKKILPLKKQWSEKNEEIAEKKANYRYYLEKLKNINEYLLSYNKQNIISNSESDIEIINEKLATVEHEKKIIIDLEKEKIKISSDLEKLRVNSKYMSDGCCPILKQQCLNIRGSSLNNEINKMIEEQEKKLSDLNEQINEINCKIQDEDQLRKQKELILLQKSQYENEYRRYIIFIQEIKNIFKDEAADINEENNQAIVSGLIKKYEALQENPIEDEANRLNTSIIQTNNCIASCQSEIEINKKAIAQIEEENKKINTEIDKKNNDYNINSFEISRKKQENEKLDEYLSLHNNIKSLIDDSKEIISKNTNKHNIYISNLAEANNFSKYDELNKTLNEDNEKNEEQFNGINKKIDDLKKDFAKEMLDDLEKQISILSNQISSLNTMVSLNQDRLNIIKEKVKVLNNIIIEKNNIEIKLNKYKNLDEQYQIIRDVFNNLPRELSKQIRKYIGMYSSILYRKISNDNVRIELLDDYEVILIDCTDEKKVKTLSQLSGGEQMSVAISIRLAMLKQITNINIYFMDEPTINLDYERRMMVAEVVKDIANELEQLFVISHDDTFENITDNTIKICKINNESQLDD